MWLQLELKNTTCWVFVPTRKMVKVTVELIKNDILGELTDTYCEQFPELEASILQMKDKPNCGACKQRFFSDLSQRKNLEMKFKKIYGNNTELDEEVVTFKVVSPNIGKTITNVFFLPIDNYKDFIEQFSQDKIIRTLSTSYIEEKKEIILTIVYNIKLHVGQ